MSSVTMKQLLEAGVHFGHQTRRWNPKMRPYIFGARNGIHIIDLQQTVKMFRKAYQFLRETVANGDGVLFVGTKKQAQNVIQQEGTRCGMFYVNNRWLGGMLTNFHTIKKSISRMKELEATLRKEETFQSYTKKEILGFQRELGKLEKSMIGIKDMDRLPGAVYLVDPRKERIALNEAKKLKIPIVAIVDTNCDPDGIEYLIPGNDDAIRAISLFTARVADACSEGLELRRERLRSEAEEVDLVEESRLISAREGARIYVSPEPRQPGLPSEAKEPPTKDNKDQE